MRSPHKRFEGLPKQKKISWSGSDKDVNTGTESPDSASITSSSSSHENNKRRYSVRPQPGSPKKGEKSPSKKIIPKNMQPLLNKMEYADLESLSREKVNDTYVDEITKQENVDEDDNSLLSKDYNLY